ncbi:carbohydrate ABC transporter permease [Oryzibacter oryziterrae]|uniref:carbohydrate ABC transporter permease n=1 Tax=Oryzibacter oryziterrae TaxID=2766474 RepID=UPI001F193A1F|nr:sugar ABC transporter permease [Oryzibacter oryziterrae]
MKLRSKLDAPVHKNLIYILPGLILYAAFVFGPIVSAVGISLTDWNGLGLPTWVGLQNYAGLFSDERFYLSLKNNAELMVFYCVLPLGLGIGLAAILWNMKPREQLMLRTMLFLPYIMPTAVLGIIWAWLYNPAFGPINQGLRLLGLGSLALPWLGDFTFVLPAVGLVATWYFFGFCMVIFMSGMQRLDPNLFDAARVDGATGLQTFRTVTLPLLLPEIRVVLLLTVIASIKSFDLIFTMTRGGPANATLVPNIYMYQLGFQLNRFGYAAAVAIIGAILIFTVNYAIHRLVRPADEGAN